MEENPCTQIRLQKERPLIRVHGKTKYEGGFKMRPEFKNVEAEVAETKTIDYTNEDLVPETNDDLTSNDETNELAAETNDDLTSDDGSNELAAEYVRVTSDALNVRKEPYKESEPLVVAEKGALLQKLGDAGDWTKVINASGVEGYCMTLFLEKVGE